MRILIDMDNVVANLTKKWLDLYNLQHNDNVLPEHLLTWQIEEHAKKCPIDELHNIIGTPGFFSDLEVIPDAIEVSKRLKNAGHELYFVTATPYNNSTGSFDKNNWIETYFPHIGKKHVIHTHIKHIINGDLLFDDGPENIINFPGIKVVMDAPYNRNLIADYRTNNWLDFEKIIIEIMNKSNIK